MSALPEGGDERKPDQIHNATYSDTAISPLLIGLDKVQLGYLWCRLPASQQFREKPLKNDFHKRESLYLTAFLKNG